MPCAWCERPKDKPAKPASDQHGAVCVARGFELGVRAAARWLLDAGYGARARVLLADLIGSVVTEPRTSEPGEQVVEDYSLAGVRESIGRLIAERADAEREVARHRAALATAMAVDPRSTKVTAVESRLAVAECRRMRTKLWIERLSAAEDELVSADEAGRS